MPGLAIHVEAVIRKKKTTHGQSFFYVIAKIDLRKMSQPIKAWYPSASNRLFNSSGLATEILTELKEKYKNIKRILVIPYLNRNYYTRNYDETLYPPLENVPFKFCISKRNEWMVNEADFVIAFVKYSWGGAAKTLEYAKRKKVEFFNLAELY